MMPQVNRTGGRSGKGREAFSVPLRSSSAEDRTRQQGNKATRQQGNEATRQPGNQATRGVPLLLSSAKHNESSGRLRGAFSLAELMIALVILGFGLMVIGAALPIGLTYTRQTAERAVGEVAAEYALDTIEQHVRLCGNPLDTSDPLQPRRYYTDLFRPRGDNGGLADGYEPLIKVWPLMPQAIVATPGGDIMSGEEFGDEVIGGCDADVSGCVDSWLDKEHGITNNSMEVDLPFPNGWIRSSIPSVMGVYPPVTGEASFTVDSFLPQLGGYQYETTSETSATAKAARLKALERRITWTAFYRRVSYATGSDPHLYEVIAMATRLPSATHRFGRPSPNGTGPAGTAPVSHPVDEATFDNASDERAYGQRSTGYHGRDTLAPVPWLVTFSRLHLLNAVTDYDKTSPDRPLNPAFVDPPTLRFEADNTTGGILPAGSIFIPAVNDQALSNTSVPAQQMAGFVPYAPDTLPIYEVVERNLLANGNYEIIVKNNGFYPWVHETQGTAAHWPVWVIPPAFEELDDNFYPVFEDQSPVLTVARRIIWFPKIP